MLVVRDWLKEYIGDSIPQAKEIEELLTFHSFEIEGVEEVNGKEVIDVDVLPNRSSDCLCHRGIAREIATVTGNALEYDPFADNVVLEPKTEKITVSIENPKGCRRFGAALVTGVSVGPSPDWLKARLEAVGQRSINNVVDITNYVMLSLGQPLHAYDGDAFPQKDGVWQFKVRYAKEKESVTILGGEEYKLDSDIQVITENTKSTPVGIAGIKGGASCEVDQSTKIVIIEAANFDPTITRKAAQKLKLPTDASKRFENGVSPEVIPYALAEAVRLLQEVGGGVCEGYLDAYPTKIKNNPVSVSLSHMNAHLGVSLDEKRVEDIFARLGFSYQKKNDKWEVTAPFERTDIAIAEDVIEEVGRVYGYEHITSVMPKPVLLTEYNARQYYSEKVRKLLIGLGFSEVVTSSFRKKDEVALLNALASDKGCVRSSLVKNIAEVLDKNAPLRDLLGCEDTRIFEIGTVFTKAEQGIKEYVALCLGVRTKKEGYSKKDDEILSAVVGELTNELDTNLSFEKQDGVAELNFSEVIQSLPVPNAYDSVAVKEDVQYKAFSIYPHMSRDIALWVESNTSAQEVEEVLNKEAGVLRVRTTLFDEFEKEGRTSYAFRLVFQSNEKTLTDDEVNAIMDHINQAVSERGWEVR